MNNRYGMDCEPLRYVLAAKPSIISCAAQGSAVHSTISAMPVSRIAAVLSQRLEFRLRPCRERITIDVQNHRNKMIVAHHADKIDHTALSKPVLNSLENRI